jgi:hypothetical protein
MRISPGFVPDFLQLESRLEFDGKERFTPTKTLNVKKSRIDNRKKVTILDFG